MTCERYWREGILLAERGEDDPHRETCDDCRRAHEERDRLIRAMPAVGAGHRGDPDWQTHVWSRIARDETARVRRSYWLGGGVVAAAAAAMALLYMRGHGGAHDGSVAVADRTSGRPRVEIVAGQQPKRGGAGRVGDRIRISVGPDCEARLYRADQLLLRCPATQGMGSAHPAESPYRVLVVGCTPDARGLVAEADLAAAGEYQVYLISVATADPAGGLDRDLAAVVSAGGEYDSYDVSVR